MLTALIVDDEEINRETLHKMLDLYCHDVKVIGKCESIEQAIQEINSKNPELVFLDIEMPEGNGFELFEYFSAPDFDVIFTTAHAAYAIKAIKFAALDYLLKPINLNELKCAVERAISNRQIEEEQRASISSKERIDLLKSNYHNSDFKFTKIALPSSDGIELFELDEILRCEASRAYCNFYFTDGTKKMVSKSLKEFEDLLLEGNFFRVHKSNIVNLKHVTKYLKGKGGCIVLSDGSLVPVAVRKKEELLGILYSQH